MTPARRFEVSRRIRDEFENGRDYYSMHGTPIRVPTAASYSLIQMPLLPGGITKIGFSDRVAICSADRGEITEFLS